MNNAFEPLRTVRNN